MRRPDLRIIPAIGERLEGERPSVHAVDKGYRPDPIARGESAPLVSSNVSYYYYVQ